MAPSAQGHISFGVKLDVTDTAVGPMIIDIQSGAIASFNDRNPSQAHACSGRLTNHCQSKHMLTLNSLSSNWQPTN